MFLKGVTKTDLDTNPSPHICNPQIGREVENFKIYQNYSSHQRKRDRGGKIFDMCQLLLFPYLGSWGTSNFSLEKCVPSLSKTSIPENLLKDRG